MPDFTLELPNDNDDSDDEEDDDPSEGDAELIEKFLETRSSSLFIVRNLHIVNVPLNDLSDAIFNENYVYVQVYSIEKTEMQI